MNAFTNFSFSGRASRTEYWTFYAISMVLGLLVFAAAALLASAEMDVAVGVVFLAFFICTFFQGIAVTVRRLHDTNRSGWWWWLNLIPLGGFVVLVFMFFPSDARHNEYGAPPV